MKLPALISLAALAACLLAALLVPVEGALEAKKDHDAAVVLASGARTATSTGESAVRLPGQVNAFVFRLDLTAAATDAADTLDVFVQTKADGAQWLDVVHFTQCVGDGGAKRYYAKIVASAAQAEFEDGAALGAAAVRNILGDEWRVRFDIVDADKDCSFAFSVAACPM